MPEGVRPKTFVLLTDVRYSDASVFVQNVGGKVKTTGTDSLLLNTSQNLISNQGVSVSLKLFEARLSLWHGQRMVTIHWPCHGIDTSLKHF